MRALGIQFSSLAGTLVNQGTILGGVTMGDFANDVTLHTGSVITQGGLNMGTSTASRLTLDGSGSQNLSTAVGTGLTFNGALTKAGAGTWTIDRELTYTGGTTVSAGTLVITNVGETASVLGTGDVMVNTEGTLAGIGTVLGDTFVAGTLAPGNSPGAMQFAGGLFLEGTAVVQMELASLASFDEIGVGGLLTYDGELRITLLGGYFPGVGDTFDLFDAAGVAGGSQFDDITFNVAGYEGTLDYGTGLLTITAVPEPSAAALILFGGLLLARGRRIRLVAG